MQNARLDKTQTEIMVARRNINNIRYVDEPILTEERKEELKGLLMKVKEESEKADLKPKFQKTKIMASGLITSWEMDGERVTGVIFMDSKNTTDGNCSHETKRCLCLGRKGTTNLNSASKIRDTTLLANICRVKSMVFPVFMYRYESWNVKKAECRRIDFKLEVP